MTKWYCASIIMMDEYKNHKQEDFPLWENLVLIKANTEKEALEKAKRIGKIGETDFLGTYRVNNRPAQMRFVGIRDLLKCENEDFQPSDGTEVFYSELSVKSKQDLMKFINGKKAQVTFEELVFPSSCAPIRKNIRQKRKRRQ